MVAKDKRQQSVFNQETTIKTNVGFLLVVGALLISGLAFFWNVNTTTIRNRDDIEEIKIQIQANNTIYQQLQIDLADIKARLISIENKVNQ